MKNRDEIQKLYADRASFYDRVFINVLGWEKQLKAFFRKTDYLQSNIKILDAGCGTGVITRVLYQLVHETKTDGVTFHAFDLTQEMLDVFQQWIATNAASNIELAQADVLNIETLPAHWNSYDLIVTSTMLEYLPRHRVNEALTNLKHLLRQDGILLVFITKRNFVTRWLASRWWKTNLYNEQEIETQLHEAGFREIKFKTFSSTWSGFIMVIESKGENSN